MAVRSAPPRPKVSISADLPSTFRQRVQAFSGALRNLPRATRLVWQAHRVSTAAIIVLTVIAAIIPATQAYIGKLIVDGVVGSLNNGATVRAGLETVIPYLLMEFGLIAV